MKKWPVLILSVVIVALMLTTGCATRHDQIGVITDVMVRDALEGSGADFLSVDWTIRDTTIILHGVASWDAVANAEDRVKAIDGVTEVINQILTDDSGPDN